MKICAVVVTFNRPKLLKRCIEALLAQTRPLDEIIVVDNASEVLAGEALRGLGGRVSYFRLKHNVGGGGGFYLGLREAFTRAYDAVWLMDDDGVPELSALAALCEGMRVGHLEIANCLVVSEEDHSLLSFGMSIGGKTLRSVAQARERADSNGIVHGHFGSFNGTLISRRAYDRLGDIKFECFIWGDEVEYEMRARANNVVGGNVVSAIHFHPRNRGIVVRMKPLAPVGISPPPRSHFFYRNMGYNYLKYLGWSAFVKNAISYLITLSLLGKFREVWKFIRYYLDGAGNFYRLSPSRNTLRTNLEYFVLSDGCLSNKLSE